MVLKTMLKTGVCFDINWMRTHVVSHTWSTEMKSEESQCNLEGQKSREHGRDNYR